MRNGRFDEEFTPQSPWLDLVNSEHWDGFGRLTDHLLDARWVARFLRYWETAPGRLHGKAPRARLLELRKLLRRATETIASGGELERRDLRALNAVLKAPGYLRLVPRGREIRVERKPVRRDWAWVRSQIAESFVSSFLDEPGRIKVCGNPLCRWAFLDATKSNIRRWCRDRRCGNRDRVRRARARHRSVRRTRLSGQPRS